MTRVFIYGFGPYLSFEDNITQKIVESLRDVTIKGFEIKLKAFDVKFDESMFLAPIKRFKPNYILGMGQHPRARRIRIERRGVNLMNHPHQPPKPIKSSSDEVIYTSLKVSPCEASYVTYDAGTYVCNYSMYTLESFAESLGYKYAFFHVPKNFKVKQAARFIRRVIDEL